MTRTDIHRPAVIVPAEYDYVAIKTMRIEDLGDAAFLKIERERLAKHKEKTGADFSQHSHGGSCHVCGAHAMYLAVFYHKPTNVYICTGFDCAEKMEWDSGLGEAFRKKVRDVREAAKGKKKAQAVLSDAGLSQVWEIYVDPNSPDKFEENTISDIVGKLVKWGSVSPKQIEFLRKLVQKVTDRPALEAKRQEEWLDANPVPLTDKRIRIEGEVTSLFYDEEWGRSNMIVKTIWGWVAKGTRPSGLEVQKGDKVEFLATVKPSKNNEKFGYFSRPTQAKKV